jgi:hypothetical protein
VQFYLRRHLTDRKVKKYFTLVPCTEQHTEMKYKCRNTYKNGQLLKFFLSGCNFFRLPIYKSKLWGTVIVCHKHKVPLKLCFIDSISEGLDHLVLDVYVDVTRPCDRHGREVGGSSERAVHADQTAYVDLVEKNHEIYNR